MLDCNRLGQETGLECCFQLLGGAKIPLHMGFRSRRNEGKPAKQQRQVICARLNTFGCICIEFTTDCTYFERLE